MVRDGVVAVAEEDAPPLVRAGIFAEVNGTRHAHEIPDFADPYAPMAIGSNPLSSARMPNVRTKHIGDNLYLTHE